MKLETTAEERERILLGHSGSSVYAGLARDITTLLARNEELEQALRETAGELGRMEAALEVSVGDYEDRERWSVVLGLHGVVAHQGERLRTRINGEEKS